MTGKDNIYYQVRGESPNPEEFAQRATSPIVRCDMRFFMMRVFAPPQGNGPQAASEAYVSCWINYTSRESALEKATTLIRSHGWSVAEVAEDYPISREDYSLKPEGLKYYEQAPIDGEVAVFFIPK